CTRAPSEGLLPCPPWLAACASSRRSARVARSKGLAHPSALSPQPSALYANLPDPLPSALCPLPSTSCQLLAGTAYDPSMSTTDDDWSRLAAERPDYWAGALADDAPEHPRVLGEFWQDDAFVRRTTPAVR